MRSMQCHRWEWSSEVTVVMTLKQRFLSSSAMTQRARGLPGPGLDACEELKELFIHGNPHQHQTKQGNVESGAAHTNPSHSPEERARVPFIIHLKALSLAPRLWLTLWVLGMKSLLLTYQFFISLKWKYIGLKGKICFEESFHKVITYNNYEHWMHNMKEHVC